MGRFRDLWASGKFIIKERSEDAAVQQRHVAQLFADASPELAVPVQSRAIFDALKARRGEETGRWLHEIASANVPKIPVQTISHEKHDPLRDTLEIMNTLFTLFSDLAFEFNKSAAGASDLLISVGFPTVLERASDDWTRPPTRTCHARLTTLRWVLIFSGTEEKISVLLIPSGMLLAFTIGQVVEGDNLPFMEFARSADASEWSIDGVSFSLTVLPYLAKELLGDLVRVSSGVMSETEILSGHNDKLVLGGNLAVGFQKQAMMPTGEMPQTQLQKGNIQEACDAFDEVIELELNRLYVSATESNSGSTCYTQVRKEISAVEAFRTKMMEAFEQYTHATHPIDHHAPTIVQAELMVD